MGGVTVTSVLNSATQPSNLFCFYAFGIAYCFNTAIPHLNLIILILSISLLFSVLRGSQLIIVTFMCQIKMYFVIWGGLAP